MLFRLLRLKISRNNPCPKKNHPRLSKKLKARGLRFCHHRRRAHLLAAPLDRPEALQDLVAKHAMFPTHEGAEDILGRHFGVLCQTAGNYAATPEEADRQKERPTVAKKAL